MPGWGPPTKPAWSPALRPRAALLAAAGAPTGPRPPHILASPPGSQAPVHAINYTPKTNQIHPPGVAAPLNEMNYSLLPSGGMGMGAGAASYEGVPSGMGAFQRYSAAPSEARNTFAAGAPPLSPNPYGTGPGTHTVVSGAGSRPFSQRTMSQGNLHSFGAGQSTGQNAGVQDMTDQQLQVLQKANSGQQLTPDEQAVLDGLEGGLPDASSPSANAPSDTETSDTGTAASGSSGSSTDQSQGGSSADAGVVADNPDDNRVVQTASIVQDPKAPPPTGWHSEGNPNDPPNHPYALWWVSDDGTKRIFVGSFQYGLPGQPPRFVRATAADTQAMSTGVTLKSANPKTPPHVTLRLPDGKNHEVLIDPSTGLPQKGADGQPVDLGLSPTQPAAPKPPAATANRKQVIPGVAVLNADGTVDQQLTTALQKANQSKASASASAAQADATTRAQSALATDKPYTTFVDKSGATWAFNSETGDAFPLTAADPQNGIYTAGNSLVKVDDDGKANVIYSAPHNWSITTVAGTTIAYDPQDPTNHLDLATDPTVAQTEAVGVDQAKATLAKTQQDLVTGQISNEDAASKLAITAHDLQHPQPTFIGTSDVYIPPGAQMDIDYGQYGGLQHVSGGAIDPQASQISDQIGQFLKQLNTGQPATQQTTKPTDATTSPTTTQQASQQQGMIGQPTTPGGALSLNLNPPKPLAPGEAGTAAGDPMLSATGVPSIGTDLSGQPTQLGGLLPPGQAGMPGTDPRLSGNRNPGGKITNADGTTSAASPNVGSTLEVGLPNSQNFLGGTNAGAGQDTFMGRGLTPTTGRGSTGIGWQQKQPGWQPGSGHTSAGGRGGGGAAGGGGAGQEVPGVGYPPGTRPLNRGQAQAPGEKVLGWNEIGQWLGDRAADLGVPPTVQQSANPVLAAKGWGGAGQDTRPQMAGRGRGLHSHLTDPLYHFAMALRKQRGGVGTGQDEAMPPPDPMQSAMGAPPPTGGPPPAAPSPPPGGSPPTPGAPQAGWTPPVPPQAVAGIGHRFGQQMDVGEPQHSGVDLQAPEGTPTVSPVDGMVERVEHNPQGLGLTVVLRGKDGSEHRLGHLSRTDVYPGMLVSQGQDLQSKVGSSGNTTGAHLHWGVRDQQGQPQDPTSALGPMANLPPVPGTQQMGPPGGTPGPGGSPPPPTPGGPPPPMQGAGQDMSSDPSQMPGGANTNSPDYQAGYQAGMSASKNPGTPPIFVPAMQQPTPSAADDGGGDQSGGMGGGQEDAPHNLPRYDINPWTGAPQGSPEGSEVSTGFSGGQEGGLGSTRSWDNQSFGQLRDFPAMRGWNITPQVYNAPMQRAGSGQDSADTRWDLYEAKDTQGFWGPGAGGEGGMGAGAQYTVPITGPDGTAGTITVNASDPASAEQDATQGGNTPTGPAQSATTSGGGGGNTNSSNDSSGGGTGVLKTSPSQAATISQGQQQINNQQSQFEQELALQQQQENDRHNETIANLQQQAQFHQDDVALQQQVNAENQRHNQAEEVLSQQATQMQQTLASMQEANQIQLQQMQEGTQIYEQQGQQAFQDWQNQQNDRMSILSSALNNPWLQQLTGMTPSSMTNESPTGGQNIQNLVNEILQPFNVNQWGAQNAPTSAGLGESAAQLLAQNGYQPPTQAPITGWQSPVTQPTVGISPATIAGTSPTAAPSGSTQADTGPGVPATSTVAGTAGTATTSNAPMIPATGAAGAAATPASAGATPATAGTPTTGTPGSAPAIPATGPVSSAGNPTAAGATAATAGTPTTGDFAPGSAPMIPAGAPAGGGTTLQSGATPAASAGWPTTGSATPVAPPTGTTPITENQGGPPGQSPYVGALVLGGNVYFSGTFVKDASSDAMGMIQNGQFIPFTSFQQYVAAGGPVDPKNPNAADFTSNNVKVVDTNSFQQLTAGQAVGWGSQQDNAAAGYTPQGTSYGGADVSSQTGAQMLAQAAQTANPGAQAPAATGPSTAGWTPTQATSGAPNPSDPTFSQWQGWDPFQMAAYRTNIEALGPGAWNQQQAQLQQEFTQQGGTPNITALQSAAATPDQSAGQQMTANVFGQTTPNWQAQQSKQWSAAQAPTVKQSAGSSMAGIAA